MHKRWKPHVTVAAIIERDFDGVAKFLLVEEQTRDGLKLNNRSEEHTLNSSH